jgi:hypothetical protein
MLNKRGPVVKGARYRRNQRKRTATQAFWYRSSPSRRAAAGVRVDVDVSGMPAGLPEGDR